MGLANIDIRWIEESARKAAKHQLEVLSTLQCDVSHLEVIQLPPTARQVPACGVVASDAGLVSIALSPFHLELLHVADDLGRVHVCEFFPLTTLANDLEEIFRSNKVLSEFVQRLECQWHELSELWQTSKRHQPPMPRDVRLVADTLREIAEWAVLMELACETHDGEHVTGIEVGGAQLRKVVMHDGMLRSVALRNDVVQERLPRWWREVGWREHGSIIVGVGKSSVLWHRLALSLSLDSRVRGTDYCFIPIPAEVEAQLTRNPSGRRLGFGQLVLLKTRPEELGMLLPIDLPEWVFADPELVKTVLSEVLATCQTTFPTPGYPAPLGAAHEASRLSDFDATIVRDLLIQALSKELSTVEFERMLRFWAFQRDKWPKTGRLGRD
ncbi:MAG: hypothetical protein D6691_00800 [Candidatus Hydrogenedentota bacterium]|nr:hypothetical protein [Candidatus Sumerlaea chitinivorans]RMH30746.1 MAG: hypothetical protein D6691_00800 [Candidatus Hydrogenedentota bacterium]